jgi:hypothetical protein
MHIGVHVEEKIKFWYRSDADDGINGQGGARNDAVELVFHLSFPFFPLSTD